MDQFKRINTIAGWAVFLFALVVYCFTFESNVSFWDCGEFISCAYKLQVPHPPGAPFFLMVGRIFTLFSFGNPEMVPVTINFFSALSSAFAVLFMFWSTTALGRKMLMNDGDYSFGKILAVVGAGVICGTACTFVDSFWFSAVEGEVYALSYFFMTFVFWAVLKWDADDSPTADRWLLLIGIAIGFSTGVHLLSLLVLPVMGLVYYLKRFDPKPIGALIALGVSFVVIAFIMSGVIAGIPWLAAKFDLMFVNSFGMGFGSGAMVAIGLVIFVAVGLNVFTYIEKYTELNKIVLWLTCLVIGYSSFLMVPIRSDANPPINMNKPKDPFSLLSYLNREQYGERPLLFGPNYTADQYDLKEIKETDTKYAKGKEKYEAVDKKVEYVWKPGVEVFFPRMGFWTEQSKIDAFRSWLKPEYRIYDRGTQQYVMENGRIKKFGKNQYQAAKKYVQEQNKAAGNPRYALKDDIGQQENFGFFFKYQIGYMYLRYFMWNFVGRQNDIQGTYYNEDGRWISGIPFIDNLFSVAGGTRLNEANLPSHKANNFARNKFYAIPFLLGVLGMIWHFMRDPKNFSIVFFLFFITGLLQVVYHNQPPIEPRERDYVFAGSFLAYCVWIGFGVLALYEMLKEKMSGVAPAGIAIAICALAPLLMGTQGWDDHDRSPRYTARDFAINYLESCQPNAILFTQGDNDTYPLWYAQEVEGIRTDVRIVNLSLVGVDWYIDQLRYKTNDGLPLKLSFRQDQVWAANRNVVRFKQNTNFCKKNEFCELADVMNFIAQDKPEYKTMVQQGGELENYLPTKNFKVTIDSSYEDKLDYLGDSRENEFITEMRWSINKNTLMKNDLILLDIIASNIKERPIYFAVSVGPGTYLGLNKFFQMEGLAYRVVPAINNGNKDFNAQYAPVRTDHMYDNLMNKFVYGNLEKPETYLDEQIVRMTMNFRTNYIRLAEGLTREGDNAKAIEVLNRSLEAMPPEKIPLNAYNMTMPATFLAAGDSVKGREVMQIMLATAYEYLDYYTSLDRDSFSPQLGDVRNNMAVLGNLQRQAQQFNLTDLSQEINQKYQFYQQKLSGGPPLGQN